MQLFISHCGEGALKLYWRKLMQSEIPPRTLHEGLQTTCISRDTTSNKLKNTATPKIEVVTITAHTYFNRALRHYDTNSVLCMIGGPILWGLCLIKDPLFTKFCPFGQFFCLIMADFFANFSKIRGLQSPSPSLPRLLTQKI